MTAVQDGKIQAGDVLVIRYEGPRGGPGMREMLGVTAALVGHGLGSSVGLRVGHVAPEAVDGGPLAALHNGDQITVDLTARKLSAHLTKHEVEERMNHWTPPPPRYTTGVMAKYRDTVSCASVGATTVPTPAPVTTQEGDGS